MNKNALTLEKLYELLVYWTNWRYLTFCFIIFILGIELEDAIKAECYAIVAYRGGVDKVAKSVSDCIMRSPGNYAI